jgi:thiamine biosynthesis protein ThiI
MKFIVKFFPEITIKSRPVRQRLVKQLRRNIQVVLRKIYVDTKVQGFWDKIEVRIPDDEALGERIADALQRVPGIANVLRVQSYEFEHIDKAFARIAELTIAALGNSLEGKSFAVRVQRKGQHGFSSLELERYIGGRILQQSNAQGVNLNAPDVLVKLEVCDNTVYVVESRYEGLGGYPMGSQEPVLSLISGGFDSSVSSYLTMKRGIKTHFCFFNLGGAEHEIGVKQVSLYLWEQYSISHRVKFISVPFEQIVTEILAKVHHSHMGVVLKRMMMRAAEKIASEFELEAIVTGESIAQVSSQTLTNLNVIDQVCERLILRPLVTMDKRDIIHLAAEIGTEEFAKNMPEYCSVISVRPTTKANLARIEEEEHHFDFTLLDQAIAAAKVMPIDSVMQRQQTIAQVDIISLPLVTDVVVDIRHADEREKVPLVLTSNTVLEIAFYELMSALDELTPTARHLLYCEQGTMSQLHASHLKSMGYDVAVYVPA